MDGLVGGSVLRPTSRKLEMIISVYGYLRLSRSLFDFTLETIMVWMIWTAITDDSLACNVLNARTDVRIDMSFPALVGIDGVTISALIGHLINSSTPLNTAQHSFNLRLEVDFRPMTVWSEGRFLKVAPPH